MLSKSQAKAFFLGGTVLFSAVFLGLTVDSHRQMAERTNEQELSESVIRGKEIWKGKTVWAAIPFWVRAPTMHRI